MAMEATGSYYLVNDLTITKEWGNDTTTFKGNFDGKGHTITINDCPVFYYLGGNAVVKNLIIDGQITKKKDPAALAYYTSGGNKYSIRLQNITNNASVTSTEGGYAGALIADAYAPKNSEAAECSITMINCVNNGAIDAPKSSAAGGLIGSWRGNKITLINCVNTGAVTGKQDAGGLVGRAWGKRSGDVDIAFSDVTIQNGLNTGNIKNTTNMLAGGAVGWVNGTAFVTNFTNEGDITSSTDEGVIGAGGIIGGAHSREAHRPFDVTITKSVNKGTISGGGAIGAFVGCGNGASDTSEVNISECINENQTTTQLVGSAGKSGTVDTSKTKDQIKPLGYDALNVVSIQPGLGENIALYVAVDGRVAKDYYTVSATMNEETTTLEYVKTDAEGNYVYAFYIAPQNMGDEIAFSLKLAGDELEEKTYSFLTYCNNMMNKGNAELDQLLKDALAYGAAAQVYAKHKTDALVNAGITGASEYTALSATANKLTYTKNDGYTGTMALTKVGMFFDYQNVLSVVVKADNAASIKVAVGGVAVALVEGENLIDLGDGSYRVLAKALNATEIASSDAYTITVSDGETLVGTLTYNAQSYVYTMQNLDNAMGALAKALYNYSLSAIAYVN